MLGEPSRVRALPQTVYDRPSGGGGRIGAAVDGSQWLPAWASRLSSGKVRRQGRRRRRGGDEARTNAGNPGGVRVGARLGPQGGVLRRRRKWRQWRQRPGARLRG